MRTATWCRSGTSSLPPDVAAARGPALLGRPSRPTSMMFRPEWRRAASTYLQVAPLVVVFLGFLVFPIGLIGVVSFWDYTEYAIVPDFILRNYAEVFASAVTYKTYL